MNINQETGQKTASFGREQAGHFSLTELNSRVERVRSRLREKDLEGMLVFSPENIYYLTGLNHQGFFSPHILIVPRQGRMRLIMRSMEQAAFEAQIKNAVFAGHNDDQSPGQRAGEVVKSMGLQRARLGLEKQSLFTPITLWEDLQTKLPGVRWHDASLYIDRLRMTKSPEELRCIREASRISLAMMQAARETARPGLSEAEIAAEVLQAMVRAGGELPGFGPFIRATPTMAQEHVTWSDYRLRKGDTLFVELSGCYNRYHAPMGRLFFLGEPPAGTVRIAEICNQAFESVVAAMKPGQTAGRVYQAWQDVVDRAGLRQYQRHHCGYMIGIGFPPSWVGGSGVVSLRRNSQMVLETGMSFHLLSWLVGSGPGDYLLTDTACVTENGGLALRQFPIEPQVIAA
ncbi:MAG: M24 family metallopeptidase [Thermodesulfobacteriota bacterium]